MELKHDHLTRQLTLIPVRTLGMPINIIGCGAIGSFAALSLAKMGLTRIRVWDFDEVSIENMSNQFFRFSDIGRPKALALQDLVHSFTGVEVKINAEFIPAHAAGLEGIVITAVDSMEVRGMIYRALLAEPNSVKYIIDPRMGAEHYAQYAVKMDNHEWYKKTLYTDENAVAEACTAKSTVYTATLASGVIVKTIKNIITEQPYPKNVQWNIAAAENPMVMFPAGKTTA